MARCPNCGTIHQHNTCNHCSGNGGWFLMPNGDHYLNREPGGVWTMCEHCNGTGEEPNQ